MVNAREPSTDVALRALAEVMRKYHLSIAWDCDSSSDTFGIRGEHMEVEVGGRTITVSNESCFNARDVISAIEGG